MEKCNRERIALLAEEGLRTDGGHHKQWFLERIAKACGSDIKKLEDVNCSATANLNFFSS